MKKCFMLFSFLVVNAGSTIIDLSGQKIGNWDIKEKVNDALLRDEIYKQPFILVLSDNYIDDEGIKVLMALLSRENNRFSSNLKELHLSNNRITIEGAKMLLPLLKNKELNWLDLSVNSGTTSMFGDFFRYIQQNISGEEEQREIAQKVVWLSRGYDAGNFFNKQHPFYDAHNWYYGVEQ